MAMTHAHNFSPILSGSLPTIPLFLSPHIPWSAVVAFFRANASYPCLVSYWSTLLCEQANENWWVVLQSSPVFLHKPELLASRLICLLASSCWFLAWLILRSWRWRWHITLKHQFTFNRL
jgi:hypothetical protein